MKTNLYVLALGALLVTACKDPYPPTLHPDYAIRVVQTDHGAVAIPPTCPSYALETTDPFDNQPMPQYGCAQARNLALMVEQPDDLIQGRTLGPANGITAVGSMTRYTHDQTRGLIWPGTKDNIAATTASTSASALTGELTSPNSSSSSSAPAGAAAAAP